MERPLIKQAKAAEEVASGLHVFLEEVPQWATDISATISELFAVSSAFRTLDNADDSTQYGRGFYRIRDDLDTVICSLELTLQTTKVLFRKSRDGRFRQAWEDLHISMRREGPSLCSRLELYRMVLLDLFEVLRG